MSTTPASAAPPAPPVRAKADPETLVLRGTPRRAVRFRRGLIIGIAAGGCAAVATIAWLALQPAGLRLVGERDELYTIDRKAPPESLERLPQTYGQLPPGVPQLGPPLPGDLGRPILEHQRQMAAEAGDAAAQEADAAEAERRRRLDEARQAREAPIMMQLSRAGTAPNPAPSADPGSADVPVLAAEAGAQPRMIAFTNARGTGGTTNPHVIQPPASPWMLSAGSVIAASLVTGLNSDLPGLVIAQVTENVHDSVTGRTVLVPQGARLVGRYDSVVAFGQSRALVVWQRIILPDGSSIELDNMPATDREGYAGLEDRVDFHTWRLLRGIGLSTLLGVGTELSLGSSESDLVRALRESAQGSAGRAGERIVERNLDIQPTITIRPGFPVRVMVHKDLILRPWAA